MLVWPGTRVAGLIRGHLKQHVNDVDVWNVFIFAMEMD